MALSELDTFVLKFKQLWKSGQDAHLDLESHAGKAWVGLRLRLGEEPGPSQKPSKLPKATSSPSRDRRRLRRAAERVKVFDNEHEAEEASTQNDEKDKVAEEVLEPKVENREAAVEAENEEQELVNQVSEEQNDLALLTSEEPPEKVNGNNSEEDPVANASSSTDDVTVHEIETIETSDAATNPMKEEPSQPPPIVTVYATAVFGNSSKDRVTETEIGALSSVLRSKDHLCRNIKYLDYRNIRTTYLENLRKYEHSLQVEIDIDTANLWENARSYLYHHLGKDSWTLGDETNMSLIRIHQKR